MRTVAHGGLLERDGELERLGTALELAAGGEASLVVVEGGPGAGKTSLLAAARDRARALGLRALSARCVELERDFAFGVVRQLFEPALAGVAEEERSRVVAGAAALALPVVCDPATAPPPPPGRDVHATLHGLYWLLSNLAESQPVVVLVDDAQWGDGPSLRFLDFLARRLEGLPVAVVVAVRPGGEAARPDGLARLLTEPSAEVVVAAPLGVASVGRLVAARLSAEPDGEFSRACHDATGGNPFLVHALVEEVTRRGLAPVRGEAARIRELAPPSVARAVLARMCALPPEAPAVAEAVAVLGDGAELRHVAALSGVDPDRAAAAADALASAGVVARGRPLRFAHPIVRAAVHDDIPDGRRSELHRRAAALLAAAGAPPGQLAAHLVACDPAGDPEVVATLRDAAARALASAAPETAAAYLDRALTEPPAPEVRSEVLVELCIAEARVPHRASFETLRRGLERTTDGRHRAAIALELAQVIGGVADTAAALEVLAGVIGELCRAEPELALAIEADYISVARLHAPTRDDALARLERLRHRAGPDTLPGCVLLANLALDALERGVAAAEAAVLAERALSSGLLLDEGRWVFAYAANTLVCTDRVHDADRAWSELLALARERGSLTLFMLASVWRSHLAYRCGAVTDAEVDARLGYDTCRRHAWDFSSSYALAFLVDALVERGELDEAEGLLAQHPGPATLHYLLHGRARLRLAQGRPRDALADALECGRRFEAAGGGRNPAVSPWRSTAAESLGRLGRRAEAVRLADEEVGHARAFGAGRAVGVALRARAVVEEGGGRLERLTEAVDVLAGSPARLEHTRALVDLGAELRRSGRRSDAQEPLRLAMDLAERGGARALRDRAHDELLASGLRPRRFAVAGASALTPTEQRVAAMAAEGMANREIAQALFVSLKTVEAHLSGAYRKLAITARSQLAGALEVPSAR